jgi:hypothetical protein
LLMKSQGVLREGPVTVMPFYLSSNQSLGPNSELRTQAYVGSQTPSVDYSLVSVSREHRIDPEETERVGSFASRTSLLLMGRRGSVKTRSRRCP